MERKIQRISENKVAVSKIPSRPSMYEIIDMCVGSENVYENEAVERLTFLSPSGDVLSLEEMREQRNIVYDNIRPNYPINTLSLDFLDFHLTYGDEHENEYFDKWEFVFDFEQSSVEKEQQMDRVNQIIDVIA